MAYRYYLRISQSADSRSCTSGIYTILTSDFPRNYLFDRKGA